MRRAVDLKRRLVLERPTATPDGAGGLQPGWEEVGALWADVRAGYGRQVEVGEVALSLNRYRIIVRSAMRGSPQRPLPEQRFRDGGRIFHILAVSDFDAGQRFLVCHAREEVVQ